MSEKKRGATHPDPLILSNEVIADLPASELEKIRSYLDRVELSRHELLYDAQQPMQFGYFLESGMASCLTPIGGGRSVEAALFGKGCFIGSPLAFGMERSFFRIVMQVPGTGYRIGADALRRVLPDTPHLHQKLGRHCLWQGMQAAQAAACNRLHNLEQRLARWLLMTSDRVGAEFAMTQQYLAQMLGTGRPSVSLTASQMQRAGAIRYSRGIMTVQNRKELEKLACECYTVLSRMARDLELE